MNTFRIVCISLATFAATASAQMPQLTLNEEEAYQEAMRAVQYDYSNTEMLERFIERYPASRFKASALLALEKAQIIARGTYILPMAEPTLHQLTPEEQPWQYFYENQKELTEGTADLVKLRKKYQQLLAMDDDEYYDEANYYLGYIDYCEGKFDDALNRFKSLSYKLRSYDTKFDETARYYKMQINYAKGNYEEVLSALAHPYFATQTGEKAAELNRITAECLTRTGDKKQALEYFSNYIDKVENAVPSSAYNCAVLAYESGDYKLAEKAAIKAALSNDERMKQYSYMLLGLSYMLGGQTPKAKIAFEQAASLDADYEVKEAAAYNKVVLTHETSYSPWGDEVVQFENFLNNFPKSRYTDNVSTYLTEVYMTTKNYDAALASIKKIKQPTQLIVNAKQNLLYQRAVEDYVNGNYVLANNHFTECIDVKASDNSLLAPAYYWRGEARYHLDYLEEAAADYVNAMRLSNDRQLKAMSNYSLGYVNFKKNSFDSASGNFETYTANPDMHGTETYFDALTRMGDCAYYQRNFLKAENYYSAVADSESNSAPYALFQQAFMAGLQKKYSDKQNTLDRLISRYPESNYLDIAWLEKGNTSVLQNEGAAAINAFKYVVDNLPYSPSAPQAAVQLAMAYNNAGMKAEAQKIYEMVAQKYPNTDEAATALQDLKTLSTSALYADMPVALASGDYQKVIENYHKLSQENIDFRDLQKMQLMTAKAQFALGNNFDGMNLLEACAQDTRTEAGAEAKFLVAQRLFDNGQTDDALSQVTELIQAGTPHQYWLARAIILMSDISVKNEDTFTAAEYLKSLKANYDEKDDIQTIIENRLEKLNEK